MLRRRGLLLALLAGCVGTPAPVELRVERTATAIRLRLHPAPGWRINALLPPAFEPVGASPIRFTGPRLAADSAYYAEPPVAILPGDGPLRGTLRASICAAGEQVCRPFVRTFGS